MSIPSHVDVLSLFDRSGIMVAPWRAAGFSTLTVDIAAPLHNGPHWATNLRKAQARGQLPTCNVLFAFPPCTHLASSGARWWKAKGPEALAEALDLVGVARRASEQAEFWMIENPVGRLSTHWRKPDWTFHPHEYAGYADDPDSEAYTKRTCIWGNFDKPVTRSRLPALGSKMANIGPGPNRAYLRSVTPSGFARAVFHHLVG